MSSGSGDLGVGDLRTVPDPPVETPARLEDSLEAGERLASTGHPGSVPGVADSGSGIAGSGVADIAADGRRGGPGRVLGVDAVGERVRILRVGKPHGFDFRAGQYVRLGLEGTKARKFSIASAPGDAMLEFCVALNPTGSLTPKLFALAAGAQVQVGTGPSGDFALDDEATHHVMVATVTGIAPFRSMLREALGGASAGAGRPPGGTFTLLHGASRPSDLPYRDEMARLADGVAAFRYEPTISRPMEAASRGWSGSTGRVDRLVARLVPQLDRSNTCIYACGNDGMVTNVRRHMESCGFRVRTESFG